MREGCVGWPNGCMHLANFTPPPSWHFSSLLPDSSKGVGGRQTTILPTLRLATSCPGSGSAGGCVGTGSTTDRSGRAVSHRRSVEPEPQSVAESSTMTLWLMDFFQKHSRYPILGPRDNLNSEGAFNRRGGQVLICANGWRSEYRGKPGTLLL